MVQEVRDRDKSKLRDEGILKAVVNIVDIIAHKMLVWTSGNSQQSTSCWSRLLMDPSTSGVCSENFSANATLAISTTVCCAGAAESEVRLCGDARLRPISILANLISASWPKSKLAEVEIGRSRNWPKSKKLAEVEQTVFALFLLSLFLVFSSALPFYFSLLFSCSYSSLSSFCGCSVSVFVPKNQN